MSLILGINLLFIPQDVYAATCNWTGGTGDWETPGNWSCGGVPDEDDDVTIDANVTVSINSATTINSLTIGDSGGTYSPTLNFDYDAISEGALTLDQGNLILYTGSTITHTIASGNTVVGTINLTVLAGNATVSGSINADHKGYPGGGGQTTGYGPGAGTGAFSGGGGGGHGGNGGNSQTGVAGGNHNGDLYTPVTLGSAGGGGYTGSGGTGGGAIKLTVGSTATINGTLSSDGGNGSTSGCGGSAGSPGGGAGGTIYISAGTLAGSGSIGANGGTGGSGGCYIGGNGGGGRIGLFYSDTNSYSGTISVDKGTRSGGAGIDGTAFIVSTTNRDLTIPCDNGFWYKTDLSNWTFRNFTVTGNIGFQPENAEQVVLTSTGTTTMSDNLSITLGGSYTDNTDGTGVYLNLSGDVTIPANTIISANGNGYLGGTTESAGFGPGGGSGGSAGGGGGGYGGDGGDSENGTSGGSVASPTPLMLGSGGGGGHGAAGNGNTGDGGGAIRIHTDGTLTINGTIQSNGTNGVGSSCAGVGQPGAGSGGSIYISTNTLSGSGTIIAQGGDGGSAGDDRCGHGGNGGGGYITIYYETSNSWSGNTLDSANATPSGTYGWSGSNGIVNVSQASLGYATNLDSGLNGYLSSDWSTDFENASNTQRGLTGIGITDSSDNRIAEFSVYVNGNLDFTNISAGSTGTKSYFHIPNGFDEIDGYDPGQPTYSLYIPKGNGNQVGICPGATSLSAVNDQCAGLELYTAADENVTVINAGGDAYWKVSGLTSTGGFTILQGIKDTMSRLQVNTASDHEILFATPGGIDANTDTITVEFDPAAQNWDLSSITISDIDLEDDGTDVTLAGAAGAGTWGVSINTTTDTITFTAPTDAGSGEIANDSAISIIIGTNADGGSNQIVNPATAGQYEIEVRMNTTDDEYGLVEIAIVDDDTVNITSYIDSFILFDIDTADVDIDCDAAGGTSPCDSHSGATDDSGYVVDLGEMSYLYVNASGDSVTHADGNAGNINYIYFDLSTNATGGATVTIISANGQLSGPGSNVIPSVTNDGDGVTISAGDGAYGIREVSNSTTSGTFTIAGDYDGASSVFGECTTSATQIFSTTSAPMDTGRMQMQVGASPDSSDGTGTYTDTLTFIVTSTF